MTSLAPYLHLPGTAREALSFYAAAFGGHARMFTFEQFGREDGPPETIAHGELVDSPVALFASDTAGDEPSFRSEGLMLSLLGTAPPATLHAWFDRLAEGGRVVDALQERPWGASDGQVVDKYGVHWLLGYEHT